MSGNYPRWRYHKDKYEAVLVESEDQARLMGDGWADTPADFGRDVENASGAIRFNLSEYQPALSPKARKRAEAVE